MRNGVRLAATEARRPRNTHCKLSADSSSLGQLPTLRPSFLSNTTCSTKVILKAMGVWYVSLAGELDCAIRTSRATLCAAVCLARTLHEVNAVGFVKPTALTSPFVFDIE